ncbi:MAG: hypothetical protein KGJ98_00115 [Chloroflexota bacterium]|nr:hypothetical protein [Chloroflexota bacterium]
MTKARFAELQVLPVKPVNKMAAFAEECGWMAHRMEAFERTRAAAGVTMERVALMETPGLNFTIAHREGSIDFTKVATIFRESTDIYDIDMKDRGRILHGLSLEEQVAHRVPLETLIDHSTAGEERGPWSAFAAPIAAGKKDRWRALCAELAGARRDAFARFNEKNGFTVVRGALYDKGHGAFACFYVEGTADTGKLPKALAAEGDLEGWLARELEEIHGSDLRKRLPFVPVGVTWDWAIGAPNDPVAPISASFEALFKG